MCIRDRAKRIPATTKTTTLYFEIAVIHGATEMKPANAAPAPKVTSNAGRAQHSNVPTLVNRVKIGNIVCLYILFDTINPFYIIARVSYELCY